jgi:hypothetical protein
VARLRELVALPNSSDATRAVLNSTYTLRVSLLASTAQPERGPAWKKLDAALSELGWAAAKVPGTVLAAKPDGTHKGNIARLQKLLGSQVRGKDVAASWHAGAAADRLLASASIQADMC